MMIYVVTQFVSHHDESETTLVRAYFDEAQAVAVAREYNERPTLHSLIRSMTDTFISNLQDIYVAPPFDQGPRPVFDPAMAHNEEYKHAYNATLKARSKAQKAYQDQVAQERSALRKKAIIAYQGSLYSEIGVKALEAAHKLRDSHTTYSVEPVELD